MKRQRGYITLILYGIAALAAVGIIYGVYSWIDHSWETTAGIEKGKTTEQAAQAKRDNEALRQANAELDAAHNRLREQERQHAERLAQVSGQYQKELKDAREQTRLRRAAVNRGELRLRDPGAVANKACPDTSGKTSASASGRDGGTTGDLSKAASGFLLDLTGEADDTARQLAACQAVIRADRKQALIEAVRPEVRQ